MFVLQSTEIALDFDVNMQPSYPTVSTRNYTCIPLNAFAIHLMKRILQGLCSLVMFFISQCTQVVRWNYNVRGRHSGSYMWLCISSVGELLKK